ncbi:MAG: SMI1/KNR4 family protein [Planctomycetota bacterium]
MAEPFNPAETADTSPPGGRTGRTSPIGAPTIRLIEHYGLELSPNWTEWFDRVAESAAPAGEFREALTPDRLVDEHLDLIWPGLMPPHFLPLVGNRAGDWLCARIGPDNQIADVVHWFHGGGDWIPWGNTIEEALVFDAVLPLLPGPGRRHAVDAEEHRQPAIPVSESACLQWALASMHDGATEIARRAIDGLAESGVDRSPRGFSMEDSARLAETMIDQGISEVAVRCELVQAAEGDWPTMQTHCEAVTRVAPELAWGWESLAKCLQAQQQTDRARDAMMMAACCSVFTDQAVRMHAKSDLDAGEERFSMRWLRSQPQRGDLPELVESMLKASTDEQLQLAHDHWRAHAATAIESGDHAAGLEMLLMAGWHLGASSMSVYGELLCKIVEVARQAGQNARAAVASAHLQGFRQRYGR